VSALGPPFPVTRSAGMSGAVCSVSGLAKVDVPPGRCGRYSIRRDYVTAATAAAVEWRGALDALAMPRRVLPGRYTVLREGAAVLMSDYPCECVEHLRPVRRAHGNVLITGLGIGLVLKNVLLKDNVARVVVLEKAAEVISLVGPSYPDPRVEIVHADAFTWEPPHGLRFDVAWHDVWPAIDLANLPAMRGLKAKYRARARWQGCWGEVELRRWMRQWGGTVMAPTRAGMLWMSGEVAAIASRLRADGLSLQGPGAVRP
jgi:hypothetical protein